MPQGRVDVRTLWKPEPMESANDAVWSWSSFDPTRDEVEAMGLIALAEMPYQCSTPPLDDVLQVEDVRVLRRGNELVGVLCITDGEGGSIVDLGGFAPASDGEVHALLRELETGTPPVMVTVAQAHDGPLDGAFRAAGWRPVWVRAVADVEAARTVVASVEAPGVEIRLATLDDAEQLARLEEAFHAHLQGLPDPPRLDDLEPRATIAANYRERLSEDDVRLFVAASDGELVGQLQWRTGENFLVGVNVLSNWQRRGVAAALVRAACEDAAARGVDELSVDWRPSNADAAERWVRWGCTPTIVEWAPASQIAK